MPSSDTCACTALRKSSRAITRVYDDAMETTGATIGQFAVLRNLRRSGAMLLSRLAEVMAMERTSLYRMLAPMEAHGWIAIEATAGRARLASITPAGLAMLDEGDAIWADVQSRFVAELGEEKWGMLRSLLADVTAVATRIHA